VQRHFSPTDWLHNKAKNVTRQLLKGEGAESLLFLGKVCFYLLDVAFGRGRAPGALLFSCPDKLSITNSYGYARITNFCIVCMQLLCPTFMLMDWPWYVPWRISLYSLAPSSSPAFFLGAVLNGEDAWHVAHQK
jgi:hypothetical protein